MELVVSMIAGAILLAGLAGSLAIATKSADTSFGPFANSHSAAQVLADLTRELQDATAVNAANCTATSVEFTVPDRTGDGAAETIRYSWSGTKGAALKRTFNGVTEDVLADVQALTFTHLTKTIPAAPVRTESVEQLLIDHGSNVSFTSWQTLSSSYWLGEFIQPSFPSTAVDWRITRAKFYLGQQDGNDGQIAVQVRKPTASQEPDDLILDEVIIKESNFFSTWYEVTFPNAGMLPVADGACIVLSYNSGSGYTGKARIGFNWSTDNSAIVYTSDNGRNWNNTFLQDMSVQVWGTYTTLTASTAPSTYARAGVDVSLQAGADSRSIVRTAIYLPNEPAVSGP